jgi:hypothetical protein
MKDIAFDLQKGDVITVHICQFFGTSDLKIRFTSKGRILIQTETKPIDLISEGDR